jgi:hypothetical protein
MILWYIISAFILRNFGTKFRPRGGVCNILLWRIDKIILWGHLLASDLDFYDDEPLNLDDDAS